MDTNPIYRAFEKRVLNDLAESRSIGKKARKIRSQAFQEVKDLVEHRPDEANLTPLQKHIRADLDETIDPLVAMFAALGRPLNTENVEDDPVTTAVVQFIGPLMGRIMSLELQVAALELAVD